MDEHAQDQKNPLLEVEALSTGYGGHQVLDSINLAVYKGEMLCIIGHNGAGKSTLLKAVFGILRAWEGVIRFEGLVMSCPSPESWLSRGVAFVPQGNRIFPGLTVDENLAVAASGLRHGNRGKNMIEKAYDFFPTLTSRRKQRAETLSGGEKQMLALGVALVFSPRILLLDEPSLGLAPPLVTKAFDEIQRLNRDLGVTVLIAEQKVRQVLARSDRACVLRTGKVSFLGSATDLRNEERLREAYL